MRDPASCGSFARWICVERTMRCGDLTAIGICSWEPGWSLGESNRRCSEQLPLVSRRIYTLTHHSCFFARHMFRGEFA